METWLPVVGYEYAYEVSDLGRVRSLERNCPGHFGDGKLFDRILKAKMLKQTKDRKGYPYVFFYHEAKGRRKYVHQAVLDAFVGPCPEGFEACHEDGDSGNAALTNLRWDTRKNNHADKRRHGTHREGEKINFAKLTAEQVLAIRQDARFQREIAADYGVCRSAVGLIKQGKNWAHIGTGN